MSLFPQLYYLIDLQLFLLVLKETSVLLVYEKGKLCFTYYVPMQSNAGFAFVANRNKMFIPLLVLELKPV